MTRQCAELKLGHCDTQFRRGAWKHLGAVGNRPAQKTAAAAGVGATAKVSRYGNRPPNKGRQSRPDKHVSGRREVPRLLSAAGKPHWHVGRGTDDPRGAIGVIAAVGSQERFQNQDEFLGQHDRTSLFDRDRLYDSFMSGRFRGQGKWFHRGPRGRAQEGAKTSPRRGRKWTNRFGRIRPGLTKDARGRRANRGEPRQLYEIGADDREAIEARLIRLWPSSGAKSTPIHGACMRWRFFSVII
jgi:hypothetical protein